TTFSLLLMNFGQNGFTEAILQRDQIDHFLASNLFWINVGFGLLLTIGFAACGSLLARFYGEPRLTLITLGLSATIFLNSTSVVQFALHTYGRFVFDYFARNTDNLLVGWRFGAGSLGFYKKAYDLFALPAGQLVSPLTAVAVCAMSRLHRDKLQYRRYFLGGL